MGGNLLKREVTAADVAQAFVALAKARRHQRPYRDRRWRQHRCGAALSRLGKIASSRDTSMSVNCRYAPQADRRQTDAKCQ